MKFLLSFLACVVASSLVAATDYEKLGAANVVVDTNAAPIGTSWHAQNLAAVNAATSDDALAVYVKDDAAAAALLEKVRGGYQTDPLTAVIIAAVTQYVMVDADSSWYEFWREHRRQERRIWARSLMKAAILSVKTKDDSLKTLFYLDQLRWCGFRGQAVRLWSLSQAGACPMVSAFAAQVAKELKGR